MFSRKSIVESFKINRFKTHKELTEFALTFGVEEAASGSSIQERTNNIITNLLNAETDVAIIEEIITDLINKEMDNIQVSNDYYSVSETFESKHPALYRSLRKDGFYIDENQLKKEISSVPVADINDEIWSSERIKSYLAKMDKAFTEDDFGLTVTLSYTILEGVFKAYINDQIQEAITSDQIISMSKKVRDHITSLTPSEYPPQLITLISTVTHAVAEARNSFSDSHFDKAAEASIAQICRDSVNSITRFILYFLK